MLEVGDRIRFEKHHMFAGQLGTVTARVCNQSGNRLYYVIEPDNLPDVSTYRSVTILEEDVIKVNDLGRSEFQRKNIEFNKKVGNTVREAPSRISFEEAVKHWKIHLEEVLELGEALGIDTVAVGPGRLTRSNLFFQPNDSQNLIEIADGCADAIYTATGILSICGISDNSLLHAVADNNLDKFGPGSYRDENGKWIKPTNHRPPDILRILKEQGYVESDRSGLGSGEKGD